jgi:hypothetical protein
MLALPAGPGKRIVLRERQRTIGAGSLRVVGGYPITISMRIK